MNLPDGMVSAEDFIAFYADDPESIYYKAKVGQLHARDSQWRKALDEAQADAEGYRNGQAQVQAAFDGVMESNTKMAARIAELERELAKVQGFVDEDETLRSTVQENLPECTCDSDGNLGNEVERIEFAGEELRRLDKALATVRAEERAICEAEIEALKARLGVVE